MFFGGALLGGEQGIPVGISNMISSGNFFLSFIYLFQLFTYIPKSSNRTLQKPNFHFSFVCVDAAVFDVEYARWLEENHRMMCELRAAVQEHLPENELRMFVDNCLAHYDQMLNLKSMVAKIDVFHIVSGMWKTPAERCFMWIGGFRPSELIKVNDILNSSLVI